MAEAPVKPIEAQLAKVDKDIAGLQERQQQNLAAQGEMVQRHAAERKPLNDALVKEQGDTAQFIERRAETRPVLPDYKPQPPMDAKEFQGLSYALIGLAMIGGVKSKGNWLGVADTFNGAMKGFIEGNQEMQKRNVQDFEQSLKAAVAHEQQYQRATDDVLKAKNLSMNQKNTQLKILASAHGDETMMHAADQKSIDGVLKIKEAQRTSLLNAQQRAETAHDRMQTQLLIAELRRAAIGRRGQGSIPAPAQPLDEAAQLTLDTQAWNYINKGMLPYRKGSGGGADRNDVIMRRVGELAKELNMTPQELSGQSAAFKADAQAFAASTKKLDSVQGTLESFHNNIATWEAIAKGEAPKLGGKKLAELGSDLKKLNFSDVKTLNDWQLKIRTQLSDPSAVAYVTAAFTVAMDYSRILSSQGQSAAQVTEGARNEAVKLVAAGYNDKARKALLGTMESDAAGQIKGLETQVDRQRKRLGLRGRESVVDKPDTAAAPPSIEQKIEKMSPEDRQKRLDELRKKAGAKTSSADDVIDFSELRVA